MLPELTALSVAMLFSWKAANDPNGATTVLSGKTGPPVKFKGVANVRNDPSLPPKRKRSQGPDDEPWMQDLDGISTQPPVPVKSPQTTPVPVMSVSVVSTVPEEVSRSMSYVGIGKHGTEGGTSEQIGESVVIGRVAVKVPTNDPPFSGPW
jgi:hypothetical protein